MCGESSTQCGLRSASSEAELSHQQACCFEVKARTTQRTMALGYVEGPSLKPCVPSFTALNIPSRQLFHGKGVSLVIEGVFSGCMKRKSKNPKSSCRRPSKILGTCLRQALHPQHRSLRATMGKPKPHPPWQCMAHF